jgi:hypothetical protein
MIVEYTAPMGLPDGLESRGEHLVGGERKGELRSQAREGQSELKGVELVEERWIGRRRDKEFLHKSGPESQFLETLEQKVILIFRAEEKERK